MWVGRNSRYPKKKIKQGDSHRRIPFSQHRRYPAFLGASKQGPHFVFRIQSWTARGDGTPGIHGEKVVYAHHSTRRLTGETTIRRRARRGWSRRSAHHVGDKLFSYMRIVGVVIRIIQQLFERVTVSDGTDNVPPSPLSGSRAERSILVSYHAVLFLSNFIYTTDYVRISRLSHGAEANPTWPGRDAVASARRCDRSRSENDTTSARQPDAIWSPARTRS